jgi:hypothetical protein
LHPNIDIRIVDSSLLIDADRRKKLKRLERYLHGAKSVAPPRVYSETVEEPSKVGSLAPSAARIGTLFTKGALTIEPPNYTNPRVSKATDAIRDCMAKVMGKMGHLVEIADLQVAALAMSHLLNGESVELVFYDKPLLHCMKQVLPLMKIPLPSFSNAAAVVSSL